MKIKGFRFVFSEKEDSYFECLLPDNKLFIVYFWSFYQHMEKTDNNLKEFALKFNEWEELTNELIEFGYDFKASLNTYIQQFTPEELEDFSFE